MDTLLFDPTRPIDLICMGRVAVDLYAEQIHVPLADVDTFRKYLGGCAGNIAVGATRLGLKTEMFSCVGQDEMGKFLRQTLTYEGVGSKLLYDTPDHLTGLVLLGIDPPDRFPLIFYRKDCADMQLKPEHIKPNVINDAKAILLTGTGISTPEMQEMTFAVIEQAKASGTAIIFDIDYRPVLWGLTKMGDGESRYKSSLQVSNVYQKILPYCDLIVGTEEEFAIASGLEDLEQGIQHLRQLTRAPLVIKLGVKGCRIDLVNDPLPRFISPYPVEVLNVLGAGDAFMSGLLRGLLRGETWEIAGSYANACGAIVVTRHGCAPAMPYLSEVHYFIANYENEPAIWQSQVLQQLHYQGTFQFELQDAKVTA